MINKIFAVIGFIAAGLGMLVGGTVFVFILLGALCAWGIVSVFTRVFILK